MAYNQNKCWCSRLLIITCIATLMDLVQNECSDGYTDGSVKLVNSSYMQVCVGNTWADVCMEIMTERTNKDNNITTVACREIRNTNGSYENTVSNTDINIKVNCTGMERRLIECSTEIINETCMSKATVDCLSDSSCFYGDLRESITLQICDHTGQWRSLCSKFWSSENNIVICRQLLNQNSENEKVDDVGSGSVNISTYPYHFYCTGTEEKLIDCISTKLSENWCADTSVDFNRSYICPETHLVNTSIYTTLETLYYSTLHIMDTTCTNVPPVSTHTFQTELVFIWVGILGFGIFVGFILVIVIIILCGFILKKKKTLKTKSKTNDNIAGYSLQYRQIEDNTTVFTTDRSRYDTSNSVWLEEIIHEDPIYCIPDTNNKDSSTTTKNITSEYSYATLPTYDLPVDETHRNKGATLPQGEYSIATSVNTQEEPHQQKQRRESEREDEIICQYSYDSHTTSNQDIHVKELVCDEEKFSTTSTYTYATVQKPLDDFSSHIYASVNKTSNSNKEMKNESKENAAHINDSANTSLKGSIRETLQDDMSSETSQENEFEDADITRDTYISNIETDISTNTSQVNIILETRKMEVMEQHSLDWDNDKTSIDSTSSNEIDSQMFTETDFTTFNDTYFITSSNEIAFDEADFKMLNETSFKTDIYETHDEIGPENEYDKNQED